MNRDDLHAAAILYIQTGEISPIELKRAGIKTKVCCKRRMEISEEAGRIGSRLVSSWPVVRHD